MRNNKIVLLLISMLLPGSGQADEMLMKNGSRLVGKFISAEDGHVVFDTPFAGKIRIRDENIARVTTSEPITVMMEGGVKPIIQLC
jgi:hypothetical protein